MFVVEPWSKCKSCWKSEKYKIVNSTFDYLNFIAYNNKHLQVNDT